MSGVHYVRDLPDGTVRIIGWYGDGPTCDTCGRHYSVDDVAREVNPPDCREDVLVCLTCEVKAHNHPPVVLTPEEQAIVDRLWGDG